MDSFHDKVFYSKVVGTTGPRLGRRLTCQNYEFREKQNMWDASVYSRDGVPFCLYFFMWDVTQENLHAGIKKLLGEGYAMGDGRGGNGHYIADIVAILPA